MSDQTTNPTSEEVPVAAPAPASVRPHPRPWIMITGAVVAALLFMSLGACAALGVARHLAGGGLRGGYGMTAPRDMRGGRGFHRAPGRLPSQDTTRTY
jgi:hypothetical protein